MKIVLLFFLLHQSFEFYLLSEMHNLSEGQKVAGGKRHLIRRAAHQGEQPDGRRAEGVA